MRLDRVPIDANWGDSTTIVRQFCRRSKYASQLMPAHGRYVGASSVPLTDRQASKGEVIGHNWRIGVIQNQRHVLYDTNAWKSFVHARLGMEAGAPGGLSLFGRPGDHAMLIDHLTAEYPEKTEARGRTVDEWHLRPARDNHFLDCLVGATVAASMCGVAAQGMVRTAKRHPPKQRRFVGYL